MKYYKVTNEQEIHNGLQYKDGLNIDTLPFNPKGTCEPGGIYFTREDILAFANYGAWLREVILPEDAKVYKDPDSKLTKWKSDKVILGKREYVDYKLVLRLLEEGANPEYIHCCFNDSILDTIPEEDRISFVKTMLVKKSIDLSLDLSPCLIILLPVLQENKKVIEDLLILLLQAGADPSYGEGSPLKLATIAGNFGAVKALLEADAIPTEEVLLSSVVYQNIDIVKVLLKAGVSPKNNNILYGFVLNYKRIKLGEKKLELCKLLLDAGADPSYFDNISLFYAYNAGFFDIVTLFKSYLSKEAVDIFDLCIAAQTGDVQKVKELLSSGIDPKANNSSALRQASRNGHAEIVEILCEAGADPRGTDFANSYIGKYYFPFDSLCCAVSGGHIQTVEVLLKYGADVKIDSSRALQIACRHDYFDIIKFLLEKGAEPCAYYRTADDIAKGLKGISALQAVLKKKKTKIFNIMKEYI